jgi:hypothetical protein
MSHLWYWWQWQHLSLFPLPPSLPLSHTLRTSCMQGKPSTRSYIPSSALWLMSSLSFRFPSEMLSLTVVSLSPNSEETYWTNLGWGQSPGPPLQVDSIHSSAHFAFHQLLKIPWLWLLPPVPEDGDSFKCFVGTTCTFVLIWLPSFCDGHLEPSGLESLCSSL